MVLHFRSVSIKRKKNGPALADPEAYQLRSQVRQTSGAFCGVRVSAHPRSLCARRGASKSTQTRYRSGSNPVSFAVSIRLKIVALPSVPRAVLANRKFFRDITNGLILRSARLLLNSMRPSCKYVVRYGHWFFR